MSYNFKEIEQKWKNIFYKKNVFKFNDDNTKQKYYILDMFSYPSGSGLHVGHGKGYTFTDVISRFKRLKGFNVFHPMGFDAFGLPAEQFALKNNKHPGIFTYQNIEHFKEQLKSFGFDYDWSLQVNTCDPEYYKWTQWTFLQMYKKGLAELKEVEVNWCDELQTVLSNEEVVEDENGNSVSERGGYPVIKRKMWQWIIKITKYADRLISQLDELDWPESIKEIQRKWIGKEVDKNGNITYHLNDWIFSRQRYWGEPFPIYYDEENNQYIEENLPLLLPNINEFKPNKEFGTPLGNASEWIFFEKNGKKFHRDINTMPNWAGSCWYYLGYIMKYLNPNYEPLNSELSKIEFNRLMNVDLYVGGQEHAALHLIYARFWFMFLNDIGIVDQKEPFQKLINQGMILGKDGKKMSKSAGNVIDPMEIINTLGADTLRIYECSMGPITATSIWDDGDLKGWNKWLNKIYTIYENNVDLNKETDDHEVIVLLNKTIKLVEEHIESYKHNVATANLRVLSNLIIKTKITVKTFKKFLIMLSCFAPFLSQELWSKLTDDEENYVHMQKWPTYEEEIIKESTKNWPIQINGKTRSVIKLSVELSEAEIIKNVLNNEAVKRYSGINKIKSIEIKNNKIIVIQLNNGDD